MSPSSTESVAVSPETLPPIPNYGLSKEENEKLDAQFQADLEDAEDHDFTQVNLEAETIRLFKQTRRLLNVVMKDKMTPANQKAQVANTLSSLLRALTSQQTEIYNAERLKRLEFVVIRYIRDMPEAEQERFMEMYEAEVNRV